MVSHFWRGKFSDSSPYNGDGDGDGDDGDERDPKNYYRPLISRPQ